MPAYRKHSAGTELDGGGGAGGGGSTSRTPPQPGGLLRTILRLVAGIKIHDCAAIEQSVFAMLNIFSGFESTPKVVLNEFDTLHGRPISKRQS